VVDLLGKSRVQRDSTSIGDPSEECFGPCPVRGVERHGLQRTHDVQVARALIVCPFVLSKEFSLDRQSTLVVAPVIAAAEQRATAEGNQQDEEK